MKSRYTTEFHELEKIGSGEYLLVLLFIHNNCGGKDINITSLSLVQFFEIFRSTYLFLNSNKEIQIYLKKHFVLKNSWGSRAAGRPRLGGRVEQAAAALSRKTQQRDGRTRGVTIQGSPHWNLIFIYLRFTLLFS